MPSPAEQHRADSPSSIRCAVVTISDTRTLDTDRGGPVIIQLLQSAQHTVSHRQIVPDEPDQIRAQVTELGERDDVDAILLTGGTGISARDQTYETVMGLLDRHLPGYGELFRVLSYQEIGPAAILSRATGGVYLGKIVLTMPGSPKAVALAMHKIILPELGHLVREATRQ